MMWSPADGLGSIAIKIGKSSDPLSRIKSLETASPERFMAHTWKVNDANLVEQFLHKSLSNYQIRGEWFDVPLNDRVDTIKFINSISLHCQCLACEGYFNAERVREGRKLKAEA